MRMLKTRREMTGLVYGERTILIRLGNIGGCIGESSGKGIPPSYYPGKDIRYPSLLTSGSNLEALCSRSRSLEHLANPTR